MDVRLEDEVDERFRQSREKCTHICVSYLHSTQTCEREREREKTRERGGGRRRKGVRSFVRSFESFRALYDFCAALFYPKDGEKRSLFPQQSIYKRDHRCYASPARDNQNKRCSTAGPREVVRAHILARRRARPLLLPLPPPPKLNSSKSPFREKEGSKNEEEEDVLSSSRKRAEATGRSRKTAN